MSLTLRLLLTCANTVADVVFSWFPFNYIVVELRHCNEMRRKQSLEEEESLKAAAFGTEMIKREEGI